MTQLNLEDLSLEQLHALTVTIPQLKGAVKEELERRQAYPTLSEAFDDLALVVAKIEHFLESTRHTQSVRVFIDMGVPSVLKRVLATAKIEDYMITEPTLDQILGAAR